MKSEQEIQHRLRQLYIAWDKVNQPIQAKAYKGEDIEATKMYIATKIETLKWVIGEKNE